MTHKQKRLTIAEIRELANSRTAGKVVVKAGQHLKYESEDNVDLWFSYTIAMGENYGFQSVYNDEEFPNLQTDALYLASAPDMEYYLRQLVELLPELQEFVEDSIGDYPESACIAYPLNEKLQTLMQEMGIDE